MDAHRKTIKSISYMLVVLTLLTVLCNVQTIRNAQRHDASYCGQILSHYFHRDKSVRQAVQLASNLLV